LLNRRLSKHSLIVSTWDSCLCSNQRYSFFCQF